MSSRQQKSAKEGSERYFLFGPNHILVILMWDDGRSRGHENVCRWFLNRYKKLLRPSKRVFLGKCTKWNLNFQNWSKALCLGVSGPTKRLAAKSTAYALRNRQGKQAIVKESKKKICLKEI